MNKDLWGLKKMILWPVIFDLKSAKFAAMQGAAASVLVAVFSIIGIIINSYERKMH